MSLALPVPPPLPAELRADHAITKDRIKILAWGYYLQGAINMVMVSFFLIHLLIFSVVAFMPVPGGKPQAERSGVSLASEITKEDLYKDLGGTVLPSESDQLTDDRRVEEFLQIKVVMRWMAAVLGLVILVGWAFGALTIYAGRCLVRYHKRTFVMVMAALNCLFIPYGTILGICTFILLGQFPARKLFGLSEPKAD
jgi:hypothetical protein